MFSQLRRMTYNGLLGRSTITDGSYEEALKALCLNLQSNSAYLKSVQNKNDMGKLKETERYLFRSGITMKQLDSLSVIHVSGTKGKGSTCAFAEAILRHHGFSTGFFSSPHLVSVRERIRLNGEPISQSRFAHFFWNVYSNLEQKREYESDMPTFFMFLTILMFHVFLEANVDVAIVEVGIGGEIDCTNIIRNPVCVGVTSLGLEHTELLGNTFEEIAYQKSGIFKPHAAAFTVPQSESIMRVLRKRAAERRCRSFQVVPVIHSCEWNDVFLSIGFNDSDAQRKNALLSINIAFEWMKSRSNAHSSFLINDKYIKNCCDTENDLRQIISSSKVATALANCKWPGRTQILKTSVADFFVDGAHTLESIINCIAWFQKTNRKTSRKILIFNTSGNRNSLELLTLLKPLNFDKAYFAPNCAGIFSIEDMNLINYELIDEQKKKCKKHCEFWGEDSVMKTNVAEVLFDIKKYAMSEVASDDKVEVLVTGSLHMVGALLTILDPDLTMTCKF